MEVSTNSMDNQNLAILLSKKNGNEKKSSQENLNSSLSNQKQEDLKKMMKEELSKFEMHFTVLECSFHEKTNDLMIKVLDKETGELIREIPSEKIVDMIAFMCEKAGLIVDKKI